jgi:hypothetical protein
MQVFSTCPPLTYFYRRNDLIPGGRVKKPAPTILKKNPFRVGAGLRDLPAEGGGDSEALQVEKAFAMKGKAGLVIRKAKEGKGRERAFQPLPAFYLCRSV